MVVSFPGCLQGLKRCGYASLNFYFTIGLQIKSSNCNGYDFSIRQLNSVLGP